MDTLRGRYRETYATTKPIAPDTALTYRVALPTVNHILPATG